VCSLWQKLLVVFTAFMAFPATAQIQQAWAVHYNNGISNGTHQAVKMSLDAAGNIYVAGFSQSTSGNLGYVTIKYAPNGKKLWASRYDPGYSATPSALVLDSSNNVLITGNAVTIKYDSNGNQLWTSTYAGPALACDPVGDAYVTGVGTNFNTVKLSPAGSNLWVTTYVDVGPTVGQAIVVDTNGNSYVAGSDVYSYFHDLYGTSYYVQLLTVKFDSNGNQLWKATQSPGPNQSVQVEGAALDGANNLYLVSGWSYNDPYVTSKYSPYGSAIWTTSPADNNGGNTAHALMLDNSGCILMTGVIYHGSINVPPIGSFGTLKLDANGVVVWSNLYGQTPNASSIGTALAIDGSNNCHVTGLSPGTNSNDDIVTIKYGPNGNQIWLQRYSGPGNVNAVGNAIAVDSNGNVYVTGYDTTAAGGTAWSQSSIPPSPCNGGRTARFCWKRKVRPARASTSKAARTCKPGWTWAA
jgi:hypothetical protein